MEATTADSYVVFRSVERITEGRMIDKEGQNGRLSFEVFDILGRRNVLCQNLDPQYFDLSGMGDTYRTKGTMRAKNLSNKV